MSGPSLKTIKRLFALSRNACAYPGCESPIVAPDDTIVGDVCHIRAESEGGPRYDPAQSAKDRHAFHNLILLCKNHHQVVDATPDTYTVDLLTDLKESHETGGNSELTPDMLRQAALLFKSIMSSLTAGRDVQVMINSTNAVQAHTINTIVFRSATKRAPTIQPEGGAIGHNLHMRNYALHLIKRYQDFQKWDQSKQGRGKFATIHSAIHREFGMKWDFVPQTRFQEFVSFLEYRILNTKLGRIRNAHGEKCFSTWEEWCQEQGG